MYAIIDGETSKPFSAKAMEPLPIVGLKDRIVKYSREYYAHHKRYVEERVFADLGLEPRLDKEVSHEVNEVKVEVSEPGEGEEVKGDLVKEEAKESQEIEKRHR